MKKVIMKFLNSKKSTLLPLLLSLFTISYLLSCTFDYESGDAADNDQPDLVMENVDYVRVRSADPIAQFKAERAERYENLGVMKLENFSFEQFGERGSEVNATGTVVNATVELESGDIYMDKGVRIEVESEDLIIETYQLEWKDEPRILSTGEENIVNIFQPNGTGFSGAGLRVETRKRTWEFYSNVSGLYVHDDNDEDEEEENEEEVFEFEY